MNGVKWVALGGMAALYPVAVVVRARCYQMNDRKHYRSEHPLWIYLPDGIKDTNRDIAYLFRNDHHR